MLCLIGQATQEENRGQVQEVIDIYGPEGIRDYVRSVIQLTCSRVVAPHRIHELKNVPFLHGSRPPPTSKVETCFDTNFGEREHSRDIYPDNDGIYHLVDETNLYVQAAAMQHTIPCVGFVVIEKPRPGKLRPDLIQDVVERNKIHLNALPGLRGNYMKIYGKLKEMNPGDMFTFPSGDKIYADEILEPKRDGRKVVILGDTCSTAKIEKLCMNASLVVHEATNAWIREIDGNKCSPKKVERDTYQHGHSTPEMAGRFAARVNAERLVLTHFSARYSGDDSDFSMRIMWRIEDLSRRAAKGILTGQNDILAAWDLMLLAVPPREPK